MPRAPRQIGRSDGDRVFRVAARQQSFCPLSALLQSAAGIAAVVAVILVATFFNPFRLIAAFPIDPGKISLSGTKIVMELPRLNGFTTDSRPYELTARAAAQDLTNPKSWSSKTSAPWSSSKDGQRVTIKSINGVYEHQRRVLRLNDHITLNSTSGYEGRLSEATVNVTSGNIVSESPVELKLPNGLLNANRWKCRQWCLDPVWRRCGNDAHSGPGTTGSAGLCTCGRSRAGFGSTGPAAP